MSLVSVNPLSTNPAKWSNTPKQFVGNLPTNCLSVFDHFVGWHLKAYGCNMIKKKVMTLGIVQIFDSGK